MKTLSETWFADGTIDFELKKYTLLAYLQRVNQSFNEVRLYPQLADLIFHHNNLVAFRENKKYLREQFPKKLTGIQMEKLQLLYEQMIEDDELMQELESIIHYSIPTLRTTIQSGTSIYEQVEQSLLIEPIGLIPLDITEGYLFIRSKTDRETRVFHYWLSIFERHDEQYRTLKTRYIDSWYSNTVTTYDSIKNELIRSQKELPNPAVYSIETPLSYPVDETLLPVVRRSFAKFITLAA